MVTKKKNVYPPISDVALLYWPVHREEIEETYYKTILTELESEASDRNIKLTRYNKADGIESVSKSTRAFIAIGWLNADELDFLKRITPDGIFINSSADDKFFDSVQPNFNSIIIQMVDYLVAQGHTNLGFIGRTDFTQNGKPVMDICEWSFRESAKYYNALNEDNLFITDTLSVQEGYRLGLKAIDQLGDKMPTAFCVGSDTLAVGILQAFNERNWEIPKRVAFFSIGDVSIAKYVSPPLTTFHVDIPLLCDSALGLLQERVLTGRETAKTVYVNGKPVFRKSC